MKTYISEMSGLEINWGYSNRDVSTVLIYKPFKLDSTEILGDVVSFEFVPKDFELVLSMPIPK